MGVDWFYIRFCGGIRGLCGEAFTVESTKMNVKQALGCVREQIKGLKLQLEAETLVYEHFYKKYCELIDQDRLEEAEYLTFYVNKKTWIDNTNKELDALIIVERELSSIDLEIYYTNLRMHEEKNKRLMEIHKVQNINKLYTLSPPTYVDLAKIYDAVQKKIDSIQDKGEGEKGEKDA